MFSVLMQAPREIRKWSINIDLPEVRTSQYLCTYKILVTIKYSCRGSRSFGHLHSYLLSPPKGFRSPHSKRSSVSFMHHQCELSAGRLIATINHRATAHKFTSTCVSPIFSKLKEPVVMSALRFFSLKNTPGHDQCSLYLRHCNATRSIS